MDPRPLTRSRLGPLLLALTLGALAPAAAARADEVLGTYGRWRLEKGVLPNGAGTFHMLRALEATGAPSRLALSCGAGRSVAYFSHAQMEAMTGERSAAVTVGADGRETLDTVLSPVGNLAFLGDVKQQDRILALMRSAQDVITVRLRGQTFVFTATGFDEGAGEMDRRCPSAASASR